MSASPRSKKDVDNDGKKRKAIITSGFCAIGKTHFLSNNDMPLQGLKMGVHELGGDKRTLAVILDLDKSISSAPDALSKLGDEGTQSLALDLLTAATCLLRSETTHHSLQSDLLRLVSAVASGHFDFDRIRPLLNAILTDKADSEIWEQVYKAVTKSNPPPQPIAFSLQQTPWLHKTSSFANSLEYRQDVDRVLKLELGPLYFGLPEFRKTYFGRVVDLETASEAVFKDCTEGSHPLFSEGWSEWPKDANQDDVLSWFADVCEKLAAFAKDYKSNPTDRRRPVAQSNKPIHGSAGERKLDVEGGLHPSSSTSMRACGGPVLQAAIGSPVGPRVWADKEPLRPEFTAAP